MEDKYKAAGVKRYEELEHPSDVGLRFRGRSLEELFQNAGEGMFSLITDMESVEPIISLELGLEGESSSYEDILIAWLERLLYHFEVDFMLFSQVLVKELIKSKNGYSMKAVLYGERIDRKKHSIMEEIKAPTYQFLSICRDKERRIWEGTVIFDV